MPIEFYIFLLIWLATSAALLGLTIHSSNQDYEIRRLCRRLKNAKNECSGWRAAYEECYAQLKLSEEVEKIREAHNSADGGGQK